MHCDTGTVALGDWHAGHGITLCCITSLCLALAHPWCISIIAQTLYIRFTVFTTSPPDQMFTKGLHKSMPDTCRFQPVLLQTVLAACMIC